MVRFARLLVGLAGLWGCATGCSPVLIIGAGIPSRDTRSATRPDEQVPPAVAGAEPTYALLNGGSAKRWRADDNGPLGLGSTDHRGADPNKMGDPLSPVNLGRGKTATILAANVNHTCALLNGGSVKCWGDNSWGQLGLGDRAPRGNGLFEMDDRLSSVNLGIGKRATAIAAGSSHTCALLDDGTVKCWGANFFGQLSLGYTPSRGDEPFEMGDRLPSVNLGTGKKATAIAAGLSHTCARLNDGTVKCWGRNDWGQLGLGDTDDRGVDPCEMGDDLPSVNLGTGKRATAIAAGLNHTCARLNDGTVKCWGRNDWGQLGLGDMAYRGDDPFEMGNRLPSVNLGRSKRVTAIAAGSSHTCALLDDGTVKCWGANFVGQLGLGDTARRGKGTFEMGDNLPSINLGTGKRATAIAAGSSHTCARLNDGTVKCWGQNNRGQLGLGDTDDRGGAPGEMGDSLPPVNLGTGKTATAITAGHHHTCARLSDDTVTCWGELLQPAQPERHRSSRRQGSGDRG
jgi:alpha-tubulin suppressor-like RCC1 family protein